MTMKQYTTPKEKQIGAVIVQLQHLSRELWDLVQPTPEEIREQINEYNDYKRRDLIECLVTADRDDWPIAVNTCEDVLALRELKRADDALKRTGNA